MEQVEEEEHQRSLAGITRVLYKVESRPAIGQQPTEFAVEVSIPGWQPGNGLNDCRIFSCSVVASAWENLHAPGVEPCVHPVSIEL